ncbi:MAG: ABC transporter substrate-binding protein [Thermoanaerobaculia bacterium]
MNRSRLLLVWPLVLLVATCSREVSSPVLPAPVAEDDSKPQDGGTLVRRLEADVATLNPVMATSRYEHYLSTSLFDPLVELDAALQPVHGVADKWEISPDGKEYTFHLNPLATFSDGTPVLASDVLFTLKKIVDPLTEAPQIAGQFDQADLARTRILDPHTIVIAFKEGLAPQLGWFNTLRPLPEHVYGKGDFKTDFASTAVGSGSYRLVRRVPGKEILLERRSDYWGIKPHLQTILFKVIADDATAWNAIKVGEIDETMINSDLWLTESRRPELQKFLEFRRFYPLNYNYIPWNTRDPILSDKRVRRALAMCVDLQSIINNLYHGTARAMNGPFTPDQWAYNPDVPVIQYSPQEAKRILNSLGWLDTDKDGLLDRNHKPFQLEMLIGSGSIATKTFAELYQAELRKIGVDLKVTPLDFSAAMQRVLAGNFQSAYLSWDLDPDPDPYALFHSSQTPPRGYNFVFYKNPVADKLMDDAHREIDVKKRTVLYRQLHALLAEDQPYSWTVEVSTKWAINKRVHGAKESRGWGLFGWYPGERDWWIPKSQRTHDLAAH